MKLSSVRYSMKKNLGNYESEELVLEAVIEDGNAPGQVIDAVRNLVEYKLYFKERDDQFKKYSAELTALEDTPENESRRHLLSRWFEKYAAWKATAEAAMQGELL